MKRRFFPRTQFGDKIVVSADQTISAINSLVSLNKHGAEASEAKNNTLSMINNFDTIVPVGIGDRSTQRWFIP